jgi:hypothetical protein
MVLQERDDPGIQLNKYLNNFFSIYPISIFKGKKQEGYYCQVLQKIYKNNAPR